MNAFFPPKQQQVRFRFPYGLNVLVLPLFLSILTIPSWSEAKNVFILHSYHQEYPWTKQEHIGLTTKLKEEYPDGEIAISTEYLDTKRVNFTKEYQEFFARYLRTKYKGYYPDIIFVTDDNALQFMVHYKDTIFPISPLVFCGVNDTSYEENVEDDSVYGVFEVKDINRNLHLIRKLFPDIDKVTFVGDGSSTYQAIYHQILAAAATDFPDYNLSFIANRDIRQVENLIMALLGPVVVLTTIGGFHEQENISVAIGSAIRRIRNLGDFAIISMEDVYMREGVLGGIVTSGQAQGKAAAEIGIQILSDSPPATKRFVRGANIPTFDYNELQRLEISQSIFPPGTLLTNKPISFIEAFKETVLLIIFAFFILCVLISILLMTLSNQRKAEKALRSNRNFLSMVLENLPDMVFVKQAKDLRYVRLNKAGERIFGAKEDHVIGKSDYDFFPKEEADFFTQKDREVFEKNALVDIPVEPIKTIHGTRYLHTKKIPILDEDGTPEFLLGISRDITNEQKAKKEKIELENKLKQAQKMEAIGTLAGGIAHDFNNILSSTIGYTELAQCQPDISDKVKTYLEGSLKGAERAKQLVRQILTFSRKNEQANQPIAFSDIVIESLTLLRSSLPSTITIKQNISHSGNILANATQLHQVVMNLCTNGYQAMQETGGALQVTVQQTTIPENHGTITELPTGKYAQLTITDSGKGMEKEVAERIFDPYFTTKGPEAGTGLGLSVVHGIITGLKGSITVQSELGKGTTITVLLPVTEEMPKTLEPKFLSPKIKIEGSGNGEHILLVDDEPDIIAVTENLLCQNGYRVTSFTNSKEALHHFSANPDNFDLVITDMTMPELTGVELSAGVLANSPQIAIILCTGFSDGINRGKAKEIGIAGYCEKPVALDDLLTTISSVLN